MAKLNSSDGFSKISTVGAVKLASGNVIEACIGSSGGNPPAMFVRRVRANGSPAFGPVTFVCQNAAECEAFAALLAKGAGMLAKPSKPASKPAKRSRKAA